MRAATEALANGASVGIVCKSLLGKAHTVMAEGGIAAAMANVDPGDDWRTHFGDTMRGGKLLNNWRMAQIHAQEAPDRVRELEQWGALFDRTEDGRILQRAFGGHSFRRLCHVGVDYFPKRNASTKMSLESPLKTAASTQLMTSTMNKRTMMFV